MEADGLLVFFLCVADLTLSDFISSSSSSSDDEVKGYIHNNGLNCLLFLKSHLVSHIIQKKRGLQNFFELKAIKSTT
ncbi:hypothetical protein AAC387_Pa03g0346 [Persea americana]